MIRIIEGLTRKMQRHGDYVGTTTPLEKVQEGGFVTPATGGYADADPEAAPQVQLNILNGSRGDVQIAGLTIMGFESYTYETDVFDASLASVAPGSKVGLTAADANGLGIPKLADTAGEMVYGYVVTSSASEVRLAMLPSNDGAIPTP